MKANERSAALLRVRQPQFDSRKSRVFRNLPDWQVAERFGKDPSSFSLIVNGRRQPSTQFIVDTLRIFGGKFENWFEVEA